MTPLIGTWYNDPGELLACEDYEGHPEIPYGDDVPFKWVRTMLACTEHAPFGTTLQLELNMHEGSLEVLQHGA